MTYLPKSVFLFFIFVSIRAQAQQNHFIYLQSDDKQPFFVKLNDNVLSSSASGYLIVPKLQDGRYNLGIGLPLREGQQVFNCVLNKKDLGYTIKFSAGEWQLMNILTQKILLPGQVIEKDTAVVLTQEKATDAFSTLLAAAVHDSTLLQSEVKTVAVTKTVDTVAIEPAKIQVSVAVTNSIIKKLENKNNDGIEMVYLDEFANSTDTIRIFIVAENEIKPEVLELNKIDSVDSGKTTTRVPVDSVKEPQLDTRLSVSQQPADSTKNSLPNAQENKSKKKPVFIETTMINSDCKNYATENDFLKIRKKMVSENTDEDMIKAAKKFFKTMCFTTEQIKNLSVLFLKDEGKYLFYDAAYPFASDSESFPSLVNQLTDNYYITLFKAMLNK